MKKILLASLVALPSSAFADFIGLHGQVGIWNAELDGVVVGIPDKIKRDALGQDIPSFEDRGLEDSNNITGWMAFEHPVPILPNVRLGYTSVDAQGTSPEGKDISTDKIEGFSYNGVNGLSYEVLQSVQTDMNFDAIDGTVYWEVLDNWVSIDLGLTVRSMNGEFVEHIGETAFPARVFGGSNGCGDPETSSPAIVNISGFSNAQGCLRSPISQVTPIDLIMPLAYIKGQFDIPFSGFYGAVTFQGLGIGDNSMFDIDAEVGYMFDLTVMELGASIGYRRATLDAKDLEGLYADATLEGTHFNLKLHF